MEPRGRVRGARGDRRAASGSARAPSRVSLPHTEYGLAAYYVIAPAEASSNLARYDGVKYGLRVPGGKDLIDMYAQDARGGLRRRGQAPHHARHLRAVRGLLRRVLRPGAAGAHARARATSRTPSSGWTLIVAPTTPGVAFKLGEKADPLSMYLNDVLHDPGQPGGPARASRCRRASPAAGLPIGLQLIGRAFDEATVLRVAHAYERATDWHTRRPSLGPTADEPDRRRERGRVRDRHRARGARAARDARPRCSAAARRPSAPPPNTQTCPCAWACRARCP